MVQRKDFQTAHIALLDAVDEFLRLCACALRRKGWQVSARSLVTKASRLNAELFDRWFTRDRLLLFPGSSFNRSHLTALISTYPKNTLALTDHESAIYDGLLIEIHVLLERSAKERVHTDGRSGGLAYHHQRELVESLLVQSRATWREYANDRQQFFRFVDTVVRGPALENRYREAGGNALAIFRYLIRERGNLLIPENIFFGFLAYTARMGTYAANQAELLYLLKYFTDGLLSIEREIGRDPFTQASIFHAKAYQMKLDPEYGNVRWDVFFSGQAFEAAASSALSPLVGSLSSLQQFLIVSSAHDASKKRILLNEPLQVYSGRTTFEMVESALELAEAQTGTEERCVRMCTVMGQSYLNEGKIDDAMRYAERARKYFTGMTNPPKSANAERFRLLGAISLRSGDLSLAETLLRKGKLLYEEIGAGRAAGEIRNDLIQAGLEGKK